jgi:hypothetical protein
MTMMLRAEQVHAITDIVGAELLDLSDGLDRVTMGKAGRRQHLLYLGILDGGHMPVKLEVNCPKIDSKRRFVHVGQYSDGQLIGGVSLELSSPAT